jgi:hypothetical protein
MEPRKVIGSVDTSEFIVAAAASVGFLIGLGSGGFVLPTVAALLIGGLIAAPIAAWLVRVMPAQLLGALVGGVIVLTNARAMVRAFEVDGAVSAPIYLAIVLAWAASVAFAARALRRSRRVPAPVVHDRTSDPVPVLDPV